MWSVSFYQMVLICFNKKFVRNKKDIIVFESKIYILK